MTKEFATWTVDRLDKKLSIIEDKLNEIAQLIDDAGIPWCNIIDGRKVYTLDNELGKVFAQLETFRDYAQDATFSLVDERQ